MDHQILDDLDQSITPRERHGCVTSWLIFMIIVNSLVALTYLFLWDSLQENIPDEMGIPDVNSTLLGVLGILNLIFAILLLNWKKIGFWGYAVTSIAALGINISAGLGIGQSLSGLLGIVILYGILQISKNNRSAWDGLE